MAREIERKFLVTGEFKELAHCHTHLVQGYLTSGRNTVRVRISDNAAWLTIKGASLDGGLSRYEWERELNMAEAVELLQLAEGALIEKCRYLVDYKGHIFEVDIFEGENEGLIIAEVELQSPDEEFERPEWLGREVTGERRFYNSHLRECPYNRWNDEMKKL